ncbi:hypothetical protein GF325_12410 [Candidatus Bathyarchaeota archaeon]|nr:hypothetical protein [Candidatus Bathyarchaeota archaeon]
MVRLVNDMSGEKINFGVVGLGGRAQTLIAIILDHPGANLVHLSDIKQPVVDRVLASIPEPRRSKIHGSTEYHELLDDESVDAVVITTPDGLHERNAIDAFNAGKHVFLEKPAGINLEECDNILRAARDSGKKFQIGYQARHIPFYQSIKRIVDLGEQGPLGRSLFVQANEFYYGGYHYFRSWWRFREKVGGVMIQKICHDFDFLQWAFGKPEKISCFGSNIEFTKGNAPTGSTATICRECPPEQRCPYFVQDDETRSTKTDQCVYNADHDIMDNTQTLIQFENGMVACLGMHFFPSKAQNSRFIKISGSKADLWGKVKEDYILINPRFDRSENQRDAIMYKVPPRTDRPAKFLFDELIEGILTGKEVEPGVQGAYWSMLMVVAAQQALETCQVVEIEDLVQEYPFPFE